MASNCKPLKPHSAGAVFSHQLSKKVEQHPVVHPVGNSVAHGLGAISVKLP